MSKSLTTGQRESASVTVRKAGRPPGSKNKKTLEREQIREKALDLIGEKLGDVVNQVLDQCMPRYDDEGKLIADGCRTSQALIFKHFMPPVKAIDSREDNRIPEITVNFTRFDGGQAAPVTGEIIEGEYEDDAD